jgi:hypothetical protein
LVLFPREQRFRCRATIVPSLRPAPGTDVEMQIGTSVDVEGIVRLTGIHTPEATWFVL